MEKFIRFSKLFLFCVMIFLAGCSKSPMQKLESATLYADMNKDFWIKQYDQKTPLWSEATQYCMNNGDKPNCDAVSRVWMLGDSAK